MAPLLTIGTSTATGNLISGNGGSGIFLEGAASAVIQGNVIGTDRTGTVALGNGIEGITLTQASTNVTIGGPGSTLGNLVSGNTARHRDR